MVIPNYNGKELLAQNLPSVYQALQNPAITDYEIIVADDASQDDSVAFLKQAYADITVIENKQNKGFAGNTNTGIKQARKDLVLILNSDIQLTKDYFTPLLAYFALPQTFGVMGRITQFESAETQVGAKFPGYSFGKISPGKNYTCPKKGRLFTYYLSGANALVHREKLQQLGGFNESFNPYYYEDVDLGFRAWRLGYKLYYEHRAGCRHHRSATIKKEPDGKVKVIYKRNKFYLHYLHLDGVELSYYLIKLYLKAGARILTGDKKYRQAFTLFRAAKADLRKAKEAFSALQEAQNTALTIADVAREIKAGLDRQNISIF